MASMAPFLASCPSLFHHSSTSKPLSSFQPFSLHTSISSPSPSCSSYGGLKMKPRISNQPPLMIRATAVAEETSSPSSSSSSSDKNASKRLYIGNIPRTVTNDELRKLVEEHGAVEKAEVMYDKYTGRSRRFGFATMKTVEDANAVIENLNGTEIGGRQIKVNITEKPLESMDQSLLQKEESQFVDSGHKVYVGNLAKTVTTDMLKDFFSEKGNVISAKVQRAPGTSKSSGYGFVSFSSDEEVEAAISALNNAVLEGQKVRVNKA